MADTIPQTLLNKGRKDKFILVIDTPKVLKEHESDTARSNSLLNRDKMQFSVIGVNLPSHSIPAVGVPYRGQTPHVTGQTREPYPPAKVTFKIDNNYDNYWYLWKWMSILNKPRDSGMDSHFAEFTKMREVTLDSTRHKAMGNLKPSNLKPATYKEIKMTNDYTDYQTTISLFGLREYNERIIKFDYYNAFITNLGEINYDYRDTDEISCSFDFAYGQIDAELIEPT